MAVFRLCAVIWPGVFGTSPRHSELSREAVLYQTPGSWGPSRRERRVRTCPSTAGGLIKQHMLAPGMRPSAAGHFEFILKESMIIFKQLPALCVILILIALLLDYLV